MIEVFGVLYTETIVLEFV